MFLFDAAGSYSNALKNTGWQGGFSLKAALLNQTGKTGEGEKTMRDAIAISTEAELNNYGYQLLNQQQMDKAIETFILNTQRHPKSPNLWDSLGEGYAIKGDKKNAVISF